MYIQNIAPGAARENYSQTGRAFNMTVGTGDFSRSLLNATHRQSQADNYRGSLNELDSNSLENSQENEDFFSNVSEGLKGLSISGNSIFASMVNGTIIDGKMYNDKLLAERIEDEIDLKEINTSKKVNWNADGSNELTQQQLEHLNSRYDIKNLDGQDYYNLISDLTNMNVLRADDIGDIVSSIQSIPTVDIFSMLRAG